MWCGVVSVNLHIILSHMHITLTLRRKFKNGIRKSGLKTLHITSSNTGYCNNFIYWMKDFFIPTWHIPYCGYRENNREGLCSSTVLLLQPLLQHVLTDGVLSAYLLVINTIITYYWCLNMKTVVCQGAY